MTESRANYFHYLSDEIEHLTAIEKSIDAYPLDAKLVELVKLRVSQLNGCSFCVSYHTQRLRLMEESDERIDLTAVWCEAPCFTARELAAFRWAEAVTRLAEAGGIEDRLYADTVEVFGEEGISQLTLAIANINTWNRLAVSFQADHQFIGELLRATSPAVTNEVMTTES